MISGEVEGIDPSRAAEIAVPRGRLRPRIGRPEAANILDRTPLIAPGSDGINGVRLANAIHLSSWTGKEVPLDFDENEYLAQLNQRIREEGKFPERS